MFSLQGIWVQPLVRELRSHKPHGTAKKIKREREREEKKILSDFKTRKKKIQLSRQKKSNYLVRVKKKKRKTTISFLESNIQSKARMKQHFQEIQGKEVQVNN